MISSGIALILLLSGFVVFAVMAPVYLVLLLLFPAERLHGYVRFFCRLFLWSTGHSFQIRGTFPKAEDGPFLYLFNHESMFDVFMLGAAIPHYFTSVAANKQFSWFFWGFLIRKYGAIPIKRRELKAAIYSLTKVEAAIRDGISFIMSPEGTRTLTGRIGPFKKGPFHVALNTGVTLIPTGITGAFESKSKLDWKIRPGRLILTIGNPIYYRDYRKESIESLQRMVRARILELSGRESET